MPDARVTIQEKVAYVKKKSEDSNLHCITVAFIATRKHCGVAKQGTRPGQGGDKRALGFASAARGQEDKRRTQGLPARPGDSRRTRRGQQEDNTRTQGSEARVWRLWPVLKREPGEHVRPHNPPPRRWAHRAGFRHPQGPAPQGGRRRTAGAWTRFGRSGAVVFARKAKDPAGRFGEFVVRFVWWLAFLALRQWFARLPLFRMFPPVVRFVENRRKQYCLALGLGD